ncbi:hypothetical protein HNQ96_002228 [Aminobacter lissarensis]|uniref:Uncharacterized protein n=1 Tax=Aminobacter carboxidus TaxID=376165 RepID=A0A8E1WE67_9HYPH|nr:hypothetical protein [Aminobacter lissarensis]
MKPEKKKGPLGPFALVHGGGLLRQAAMDAGFYMGGVGGTTGSSKVR